MLAVLAVSFFAAGCDLDDTVPEDELIERQDIPLTRSQLEFVRSNNRFAIDLFKQTAALENGSSMLISPLSVTFALGMVDNGASGETRDEINKALGYGGSSLEDLNAFCGTMLEQIAKVDPSTTFQIANMAVVNKMHVPLKESFTKSVQASFDANVCYKDFAKEDIMGFINQWCEKKTNGMIKNFLCAPPRVDEYAHFLNATYFKGIWTNKFKKGNSKNETFTTGDNRKITVNMMRQKDKFNCGFIPGGLGRGITLPYGNQAFRMTLLLP